MNILFVTPSGTKGKGGIKSFTEQISKNIGNKLDCNLIVAVSRGNYSKYLSFFFIFILFFKIIFLHLSNKCNLVHLNVASRGSCYRKIFISYVCKMLSIPYVIHLHGGDFENFYSKTIIKNNIKKFFFDAKKIIVLGQKGKLFVQKLLQINENKIHILLNSTDKISKKKIKTNNITKISFFGDLIERKGVYDIVKALKKIKKNTNYHMNFYGNGEKTKLLKTIHNQKLTNFIKVNHWVDNNTVKKILINTDILILPSYIENLPMIIVEGMAAGCSIITTNVGSINEIIIDRYNGIIIKPGDIIELSKSIELLIENKAFRNKISKNAKNYHSKNLNIKNYIKNLKKIWKESIKT